MPNPLFSSFLRRIAANPVASPGGQRAAAPISASAFLDLKRMMGQTVRPENIPPRGACPTAEARAARIADLIADRTAERITIRIATAARRAPKRRPLICPGAVVSDCQRLSDEGALT